MTGFLRAEFTGLDVSAPAVTQLSKYVLDYAPQSFVAAAVLPRFGRVRVAPRLEYRDRRRPRAQPDGTVASARRTTCCSMRASAGACRRSSSCSWTAQLFDVEYQEIAGVAMPGAKLAVDVRSLVRW